MLAQILTRVADEVQEDRSVSSTEEMIAIISNVNRVIKYTSKEEIKDICVGSMDMKAL